MSHTPVLLNEVIRFLDPKPGEFIIDGTADGGGHSEAILEKILPNGKLLALDWDDEMATELKAKLTNPIAMVATGNYADLPEILTELKLPKADGLLLDLGFSSEQLERSGRGFSFAKDEPLLMTYSDDEKPVWKILAELDERELMKIIYDYSGEKFAKRIARAVKTQKNIRTSRELAEVIKIAVPGNYEMRRLNPATRTFQALRIYANNELGNLEKILGNLPKVLASGGRAIVISFHSLEDKLVKNYFRKFEKEKIMKILTKKPIMAGEEEMIKNPGSHSAKLRAAVIANNANN